MDRFAYAIRPIQPGEAHGWRLLARSDRSFDVVAERACRLGFLSASLHLQLDPEASLGLKRMEEDALLAMAAMPAETAGQFRTKATLFRSWADRGAGAPHLVSIFKASRTCDAIALAGEHGNMRYADEGSR